LPIRSGGVSYNRWILDVKLTHHKEAQRATVQCQEVADQPLPPPPFFRHDPMDRTIHRRTITSRLLGATVSHRYNDTLIRVYALLLCAVGWLFFSTLFYIVYNIPVVTRQRLLPPLSTQPLDTGAHIWSVPAASDDDELKATSSAVTGRKDSNPTTQYRSYTRPHAASLLQENPDCSSISMDFDSIERSWKERGASFRPRGVFVDDRKRFRLRFEPRSSLRETWYMVWLFAGVDRQVQLLHSMCGLEVSACTGNARRISLIELIFTTPVKRYLRSLSWGKLPFAIAVLRAIESKDTLGFLECYTEHADWRSDFAELIDTCLRILNNTGTDLQGNLHALYTFGSGSTVIVELSGKLYSWAEILKDTRQSFTLAVFTDTCLPANSALNGRRCSGQGNSGEKQVILETKIWFPGSSIPLGPSISSAESVDNQHWVIPPDFAKKRLFFDTNIKMRGHLEIIRAVPYSSHITWYPKQALIARWTHRKQIASLFRFVGRTPFSECLIEEKGKIPITTYIFSGPGEKSEKHEKAD
jgi:hypothetical protein